MKYTGIFLAIISILFMGCRPEVSISQKNLDVCVKDYSKHGCFLAMKVNIDSSIYSCIVENMYLYFYFHEKSSMSDEAYEKKAKAIIQGQEELRISNDDIKPYGFILISSPSTITEDLKKGKKHIIEHYFQPGVFGGYVIKSSAIKYWPEIVYTLFIKYGVICNSYDESGYIHIPEKQFAE